MSNPRKPLVEEYLRRRVVENLDGFEGTNSDLVHCVRMRTDPLGLDQGTLDRLATELAKVVRLMDVGPFRIVVRDIEIGIIPTRRT